MTDRMFTAHGGQRFTTDAYPTDDVQSKCPLQIDVIGDAVEFNVQGPYFLDFTQVKGLHAILSYVIATAERDNAREAEQQSSE